MCMLTLVNNQINQQLNHSYNQHFLIVKMWIPYFNFLFRHTDTYQSLGKFSRWQDKLMIFFIINKTYLFKYTKLKFNHQKMKSFR